MYGLVSAPRWGDSVRYLMPMPPNTIGSSPVLEATYSALVPSVATLTLLGDGGGGHGTNELQAAVLPHGSGRPKAAAAAVPRTEIPRVS